MNVNGKSVIITGAGGGLGSVMAQLLCKNGASVLILDLDEDKGTAVAEEIKAAGGNAWFRKADVTNEDDWKSAVDFLSQTTGKVDVLINNAGINIRNP